MNRETQRRLLVAGGYVGGTILLVVCFAVILALSNVWGPGWMNDLWDWIGG